MIREFRLFLDPVDGLEKWLNKKAKEGLRLSKVQRCIYEFERCKPGQYQYAVDYIGNKSDAERKEYESLLDEIGIRYFEKPLNLGQFAVGKIRYRPYANKGGKWATSRGMINRELLILEKKNDGKPLSVYTNIEDKIAALRERRKPLFYLIVFVLLMGLYVFFFGRPLYNISILGSWISSSLGTVILWILLGVICAISIVRTVQISLSIKSLKEKRNILE